MGVRVNQGYFSGFFHFVVIAALWAAFKCSLFDIIARFFQKPKLEAGSFSKLNANKL
jgi:hypothetical protein